MASIAAKAVPERMNKWLLIGGVGLALLTGVLAFVAVQSTGSDDPAVSNPSSGNTSVLVAKSNIGAGTKLSADMFRVATFAGSDVVTDAVADSQSIIGETVTTDLLKGQQLSRLHLAAATDDKRVEQLAFKIPDGNRALSITVTEGSAIGGNLVPGDRVDVVAKVDELVKNGSAEDQHFIRVHTVLQNVLVVAREQTGVERVVTLPADEASDQAAVDARNNVPQDEAFQQRPEDAEPDANLSTVTLSLTPAQVQEIVAWDAFGEVTLAMRAYGDDQPYLLEDVVIPVTKQ